MPWKECSVMDERLRFVAQLLDGEAMSEVCRAFGISCKTGYKIFKRYKEHGLEALTDRSRRPVRYANQLPRQIESLIVAAKRDKPHWGARKIRELLVRRLDGDIRVHCSTPRLGEHLISLAKCALIPSFTSPQHSGRTDVRQAPERRAVGCKSIRGLTPVGILVRRPAHTDISGVLYPGVVMFVLCLATRMRGPDQQEIDREG